MKYSCGSPWWHFSSKPVFSHLQRYCQNNTLNQSLAFPINQALQGNHFTCICEWKLVCKWETISVHWCKISKLVWTRRILLVLEETSESENVGLVFVVHAPLVPVSTLYQCVHLIQSRQQGCEGATENMLLSLLLAKFINMHIAAFHFYHLK